LPSVASADGIDAQLSSRLMIGGGAAFEQPPSAQLGTEALLDLGARLDVYLGDDRAARARLGPELELRTATFETIEIALGPAILVPLFGDFTLGLSVLGGYAFRLPRALDPSRDGATLSATLRFGYQPYDHYDAYSMGIHLYVTGRAGAFDQERWEIVGGLEVDLELLFVTPFRFLAMALSAHDPDEPEAAAE
jgi:hypothetical protein